VTPDDVHLELGHIISTYRNVGKTAEASVYAVYRPTGVYRGFYHIATLEYLLSCKLGKLSWFISACY
jgi:hypothetical protein